jgi:thiamine-monophosphate kinase
MEETRKAAYKFELDPTACALSGGEEYELLFSVAQRDYPKIQGNPHFTPIGYYVSASEGCYFEDNSGVKHQINAQGWRHF